MTPEQEDHIAEDSGFPKLHWRKSGECSTGCRLANTKKIIDAGRGSTVILLGPRGRGKTQVAVDVARHCIRDGYPALYTTPVDLFMALRSARRFASELSEAEVFNAFKSAALLVIDEIGQDVGSPEEAAIFYRLVDARYSGLKRTILIGNFDKTIAEGALGPSIIRRANELGGIIDCSCWPTHHDA